MKKLLITIMCTIMFISNFPYVYALDISFEGNEGKWTSYCAGTVPAEDTQKCKDFIQYMANKSNDLQKELLEIEKQKEEIRKNVQFYADKIKTYQSQINTLQSELNTLNNSIALKEEEIVIKQSEIELNQSEVDKLYATFQQRMITSQSGMRLNKYVDFIMGANSFDDLIRRSNGIKSITDYDQKIKDDLKVLIEQLNQDKIQLEIIKDELEVDKADLQTKMTKILVLKTEAEQVKVIYQEQEAELEAKGNQIAANLSSIQEAMKKLADDINKLPSSSGFYRPINGGYISAGTWAYPGGGLHLGTDYAASRGTSVYAAGNGVVVFSTDGCGDGYYGAQCGSAQGGTSGGGNQVYLISKVNNSVYGIRYLHLLAGTPVKSGTIVYGGDKIAEVGSSGNSSGPHVHVEVIYLGDGNLYDYVNSWSNSGSLSFGAGFGYGALNKICERGASAPCRVRPESVF